MNKSDCQFCRRTFWGFMKMCYGMIWVWFTPFGFLYKHNIWRFASSQMGYSRTPDWLSGNERKFCPEHGVQIKAYNIRKNK